MKKILSFIFVFCLLFTLSSVAFASTEGLYLETNKCPKDIQNYVEDNVVKFLNSKVNEGEISNNGIEIGKEFAVAKESASDVDVYYFPVFQNGTLKYTFRAYKVEGKITGILSPYLVEGLSTLKGKTTLENPARLEMNNGNVVADINGSKQVILEDPLGRNIYKSTYSKNENNIVVNLNEKEKKNLSKSKNIMSLFRSARSSSSKNLSLDLAETQGGQQWCSAFAGSAIIRYKTNHDIYAEDIMKHYHPKSKDLKNESISHSELIKYAKKKGVSPKRKSSTLSLSSVVSQINSGNPIYLSCAGRGDYKKAKHALVLRGYDKTNDTYSVWNPWHSYYETMPMDTKVYTVDSTSSFKWDATIYNWK